MKLCWVSANSWPIVRHIHNHCDSLLKPTPNIMFTSGVRTVRHRWTSYVHIRAINFTEISCIHSVGSVMVSTRLPYPHVPVLHACHCYHLGSQNQEFSGCPGSYTLPFIPDAYSSSTSCLLATSSSSFSKHIAYPSSDNHPFSVRLVKASNLNFPKLHKKIL